jgi:DNA processing protein
MEEIKEITIKDKEYPQSLRNIPEPPKVLYFRGNLSLEKNNLAVVGTRKFSPYGKQATLDIVGQLSEAGLTIISGFAPGIDTFAHQRTLECNGKTIAVLGTGLDEKSIYPKENLKLAREIIRKGGCLISEYPPGTHGSKITFPKRNRIIAGLSLGVLVIEAKERSGALITANYAFSLKKKVFALPGSIYSSNSKGPHYLIKQGAKLVEGAQDILKELNIPNLSKKQIIEGETEEERIILNCLRGEALIIDKIIEKTKIPPSKVFGTLAILELKGKVRNLGGNIWTLKK